MAAEATTRDAGAEAELTPHDEQHGSLVE